LGTYPQGHECEQTIPNKTPTPFVLSVSHSSHTDSESEFSFLPLFWLIEHRLGPKKLMFTMFSHSFFASLCHFFVPGLKILEERALCFCPFQQQKSMPYTLKFSNWFELDLNVDRLEKFVVGVTNNLPTILFLALVFLTHIQFHHQY
jgi:hypothetical protein